MTSGGTAGAGAAARAAKARGVGAVVSSTRRAISAATEGAIVVSALGLDGLGAGASAPSLDGRLCTTGPAATLVGTRSGSTERLAVGGSVGWAETTRTSPGGGDAGSVSRTGPTAGAAVGAGPASAEAASVRVKAERKS